MNGKPVFTVPSQTVLNLESGFAHKLLCDGPTFSTGTACAYSCAFCYVPDAMMKQDPWLRKHGVVGAHENVVIRRANAVEILRRQLAAPKARALADKPLVIYASPLVDVAANMDLVRETVECCKLILQETQWDIRLLSKSNLLPKVAEGIMQAPFATGDRAKPTKDRIIFGVSTGTFDDRVAAAFEQGCPLVSKRLASLHWLQDHGYRTFGMICPSLPLPLGGGEGRGEGVRNSYGAFAQYAAHALRADKCEHVWAEVINARGESFTRTVEALRGYGLHDEAALLTAVSQDKALWEQHARATFEAHARAYEKTPGKLRFLQYVTKSSRPWWAERQAQGAVLL